MNAEMSVIIIVILAVLFALSILIQKSRNKEAQNRLALAKKKEQEREQERQRYISANKAVFDSMIARLGASDTTIHLGDCEDLREKPEHDLNKFVLVFERPQIIVINSKEYRFSDIIGYRLDSDATSTTITSAYGNSSASTGSMLGRAFVGEIIGGDLGAAIGASTANRNISLNATSKTTTEHNYIIYLYLKSIDNPIIPIHIGRNRDMAHNLAGILNIIIENNKQTRL